MGLNSDEVRRAAEKAGVSPRLLDDPEVKGMFDLLRLHFGLDPNYFGVKSGVERHAVHNSEAWRWIAEFVRDRPAVLLFPPSDDSAGWLFQNGQELTSTLADCFAFVFLVTSPEADYAIAFDDHDILIGVGPASKWLESRTP